MSLHSPKKQNKQTHFYKKFLEMKVFIELRVRVEQNIWKVDIIQ